VNTAQKLVLALGAVLLVLNFAFPFTTSYPDRQVIDGGQTVRYTARHGFVPIWKTLGAHPKSDAEGDNSPDPVIHWPVVIVTAVVIVVICGRWVRRLRTRPKRPVT